MRINRLGELARGVLTGVPSLDLGMTSTFDVLASPSIKPSSRTSPQDDLQGHLNVTDNARKACKTKKKREKEARADAYGTDACEVRDY